MDMQWFVSILYWMACYVLAWIVSIVCYVTNPIVVLFCDKDGELPGFLSLWQTWDNSCNPSDVVHNKQLPSWLLYDFDAHYVERIVETDELSQVNRKRWATECINDEWTLAERFRRYVCRVYWLTRNCAYGFNFWLFGRLVTPHVKVVENWHGGTLAYEAIDAETFAWMYKSTALICTVGSYVIRWNTLIGWKINTDADVDTQAMIAVRIAPAIDKIN